MSNEPKKLKRIVIKEELVELTGSVDGAIVLNQMIYWSERIRDFDQFVAEENSRAEKEGIPISEPANGWIYKSAEELTEELMRFKGATTIGNILTFLVEKGWLSRRHNPKYKWDKKYQYRVNLFMIQLDLQKLGFGLEGYKARNLAFLKIGDRDVKSDFSVIRKDSSGQEVPAIVNVSLSDGQKRVFEHTFKAGGKWGEVAIWDIKKPGTYTARVEVQPIGFKDANPADNIATCKFTVVQQKIEPPSTSGDEDITSGIGSM